MAGAPRDRHGRPLPPGVADHVWPRRTRPSTAPTARAALQQAAALFDAERFVDAHDHLLALWQRHAAEDDRAFWKAVAQVAAACVHCQRGNGEGAQTLLCRAAAVLDGYPSPHAGVDGAALAAAARGLADRVAASGASVEQRFPRFPRA